MVQSGFHAVCYSWMLDNLPGLENTTHSLRRSERMCKEYSTVPMYVKSMTHTHSKQDVDKQRFAFMQDPPPQEREWQ